MYIYIWACPDLDRKGCDGVSAPSRHTQSAYPVGIPSRHTSISSICSTLGLYLKKYPPTVGIPSIYVACLMRRAVTLNQHAPICICVRVC